MGSSAFWPLILFFFRTKPNKAWRDLRRAYRRYPTLGTGYVFPHLTNVVCSPALDTCIFCHARHRLYLFPCLTEVVCFPALETRYMSSRPWSQLQFFPFDFWLAHFVICVSQDWLKVISLILIMFYKSRENCSTLTSITNTPTFLSFLSGRRKKSTCYLTYLVRKATLTRFFPPRPFDSKPRPTFTALGNRPAHSMAWRK